MSNKSYKVLTTIIVTAIHPNQPQRAGTIWTPTLQHDVQEAEALAHVGMAEETTEKANVDTYDEVAVRAQRLSGVVKDDNAPQGEAIEQEDGTWANLQGVRVHKDGSALQDGDEDLLAILDYGVADVADSLDGLDSDQLTRLAHVETLYGNRKGVADAIAKAQSAE